MADDNYNTLDKLKLRKLKSFLLSKDALSFLLFLLLSGLFWFVNALDKNREITIRVPLQIKNLSEQIAVTTDLPDFITVDISDIGINLFSYSNKKLKPLTISMSNYQFSQKGEIQLDAASINRFLQSYFLPSTRILAFSPDSIKIEYEKLAAKKVPVKLNAHIETENQYMLADKININPSEITVYGPEQILDTLKWIETEAAELKKLTDTTVVKFKIASVPFIRSETSTVRVTIPVVMFTEKNAELTVEAINFPDQLKIKSFPAFVKATFNVAITEFQHIKSDDISVYVDYNDIKNLNNQKYKLLIKNNNPHINNIRLSPAEVEFIIEQY